MKKFSLYFIGTIIVSIFAYLYYYMTLPAINIHSPGFWWFLITIFIIISAILGISAGISVGKENKIKKDSSFTFGLFKVLASLTAAIVLCFIIGSIASSPIVNSSKYQKMLTITDKNFKEDINESSYNDIPVLDKSSATLLGSRKMGSMIEYVSQFEVADNYTQINYQGVPTRVSPLRYGSFFKWLTNKSDGVPAFMKINMTNQKVELVKLDEGIKYSESEHFGRNINRYLRFRYPTYIFDEINFEINEDGIPYWICPVKDYTIGLFGGQTIGKVVLVNAINGDHEVYDVEAVPNWVDRVFSADLLIDLYDYYGTLKHGYLNSIFSQRDALQTTDGYNYVALEDDVWVYTGVTSVGGDESNVGFVLMNQRTSETRYYSISGAEEYSAMASAEGKVQHLGYQATFPLLLNISGEPTYFIAMKDAAGLVKSYAMVNIAQYQIVAIGDSIAACEKEYKSLLSSSGISADDVSERLQITGTIEKIAQSVVEGNSHYYILLGNSDEIFDISVAEFIGIIKYDIGNTITFTYTIGEEANVVKSIE
ncbi:MAG: CvpA family protein [Anaerocolumna sp.]